MESEVHNYGNLLIATCLLSRTDIQTQDLNPGSLTENSGLSLLGDKTFTNYTIASCFEYSQVLTDASENHNYQKGKQNP